MTMTVLPEILWVMPDVGGEVVTFTTLPPFDEVAQYVRVDDDDPVGSVLRECNRLRDELEGVHARLHNFLNSTPFDGPWKPPGLLRERNRLRDELERTRGVLRGIEDVIAEFGGTPATLTDCCEAIGELLGRFRHETMKQKPSYQPYTLMSDYHFRWYLDNPRCPNCDVKWTEQPPFHPGCRQCLLTIADFWDR